MRFSFYYELLVTYQSNSISIFTPALNNMKQPQFVPLFTVLEFRAHSDWRLAGLVPKPSTYADH